ncbi:hypothetical protein HT102_14905 [Hoyosella sp. G463]|uniref:Uncharacterized protein n=1 Tax=Lolliginicoccus lacisalsi TaxID=2742202 RepID=A0A927JEF8_9ACTN|nr:hypothetical protein [Lolliginicoccus lacisalsi]MBD8507776.1 hypothetical protein [Lolliginicoccus lacisalsi]
MHQRATNALLAVGLLAVVLVGAAVIGALNPVPPLPVATDALGPTEGEPVGEYQQRAAATLDNGGINQPRWALVLPEQPVDAAAAAAMVTGTRASRIILDGGVGGNEALPGDPAVSLPAPPPGGDSGASIRDGVSRGLSLLREQRALLGAEPDDAGCACIIGILVRGPASALDAVAARPGVSSVEALPADARWGTFAVRAR